MRATETEIFSKEQNVLTQVLKALVHPAKVAMIQEQDIVFVAYENRGKCC